MPRFPRISERAFSYETDHHGTFCRIDLGNSWKLDIDLDDVQALGNSKVKEG